MKKYKIINLKTNAENFYSEFEWRLAFLFVFLCGFICGVCLI